MDRFGAGAALLVLALLSACGPVSREPRAVRPESDVCLECRMTVVPEGHAAQAVDAEGRVSMFDDPGCLALYVQDHPADFRDALFYVQDHETRAWVPWTKAVFVRADQVPSPMNYGWHAFADASRAQAFALAHQGAFTDPGEGPEVLAADVEPRRWRP